MKSIFIVLKKSRRTVVVSSLVFKGRYVFRHLFQKQFVGVAANGKWMRYNGDWRLSQPWTHTREITLSYIFWFIFFKPRGKFYVGQSHDLMARLAFHNNASKMAGQFIAIGGCKIALRRNLLRWAR
ncbi:MAG TPA: hypothetical protein VH597_03170 [Verrucomicrobiae bacterium]|nr:hypothetical protein [Verrucomicrobiae bacterium]